MMETKAYARWWVYVLVGALSLIIVAPFAWMIATGLMTTSQTLMVPPRIVPDPVTLDGVNEVFDRIPFAVLLFNTIIVSVGRALGTLTVCAMAAYALAIIKVPGTSVILLCILTLIMVPGDIFIVPNFAIIATLRMTNTLPALFLPSMFDVFGVFLLYQFFRGVPRELVEAARLDGASYLRILVTIVIPVSRSGVVSLAILSILAEWKDLLWPLVVNRSIEKLTLGPGLALLRGVYTTDWNVVMAAGAMAALPMVLIFLALQKQFITSFARSGMK